MSEVLYYKDKSGCIHTAINLKEGWFISVFIGKTEASKQLVQKENPTLLRYENCIKNHMESNDSDFLDALYSVDKKFAKTPYY
jgi:hypothetical protein